MNNIPNKSLEEAKSQYEDNKHFINKIVYFKDEKWEVTAMYTAEENGNYGNTISIKKVYDKIPENHNQIGKSITLEKFLESNPKII